MFVAMLFIKLWKPHIVHTYMAVDALFASEQDLQKYIMTYVFLLSACMSTMYTYVCNRNTIEYGH